MNDGNDEVSKNEAELRQILFEQSSPSDDLIKSKKFDENTPFHEIHASFSETKAKIVNQRIQSEIRDLESDWEKLPSGSVKMSTTWATLLKYAVDKEL